MNSKQRRQAERNHPHSIELKRPTTGTIWGWDDDIYAMKVWCNKNAKAGWTHRLGYQDVNFKFNKHKDAMVFALRWS